MPKQDQQEQVLTQGDLLSSQRTSFGLQLDISQFEELGLDGREIMKECGIPPLALEDPDYPISEAQSRRVQQRLLQVSRSQISAQELALETGANATINLFGLLGLTALHAQSMLQAVQIILSFPELSWGQSKVKVSTGKHFDYCYFYANSELDYSAMELGDFNLTRDLVSSATLLEDIGGPDCRPCAVSLPFADNGLGHLFETHFDCPVSFDAPSATLQYTAGFWQRAPLKQNPHIYQGYLKLLTRVASTFRSQSQYGELVKRQLQLQSPTPNRQALAKSLNTSPRTLARRLAAEGLCFNQLRQQLQQSLAEEELHKPSTTIAKLAERLGFADSAAFSRAFKNWTGMSPNNWRKQALTNKP